jgi:hypothetical protein
MQTVTGDAAGALQASVDSPSPQSTESSTVPAKAPEEGSYESYLAMPLEALAQERNGAGELLDMLETRLAPLRNCIQNMDAAFTKRRITEGLGLKVVAPDPETGGMIVVEMAEVGGKTEYDRGVIERGIFKLPILASDLKAAAWYEDPPPQPPPTFKCDMTKVKGLAKQYGKAVDALIELAKTTSPKRTIVKSVERVPLDVTPPATA